MDIILPLVMLLLTYITGSIIEKKHFKKIKQREIALIRKPIVSYGVKKMDIKEKS